MEPKKSSTFAPQFVVYMHMRYVRVTIILLLMAVSMMGQTLKPAGTTPDQATRVTKTTTLSVQSGANYIRLAPANLPAVVTYMPDTAFGPLPMAIMDEDTLDAKVAFENCAMTWTWEVGTDDVTKIVEILAHEDASLLVVPTVCPMSTDTVVDDAWDSFEWRGTVYTESGEYTIPHETQYCSWTETLHLTVHHSCPANTSTVVDDAQESYEWYGTTYTQSGVYTHENTTEFCSWTDTLHLTIHRNLKDTTVYFCPGMHEEGVVEDDVWRIDYRAYQLQMPSPDWYMEGVILETQKDQALVDFRRAEQNLREHYQLPLVPLTDIVWTYRSADGQESYVMEPKEDPQWVKAGTVSVVVRFLCGAPYYSDFTTDVEEVDCLNRPSKVMENGMVVIIRGGKRYNLLGTKIQ